MEEQTSFCSACGAPQIRVRTPELSPENPALPEVELTPGQIAAVAGVPANLTGRSGIQWKSFARTAAPLAAFTGMLTVVIPPLGFFILFPMCLILSIRIYQRLRPTPMRGGQGARMGALMGLLSFVFFMAFLLGFAFFYPARYQSLVIEAVKQIPNWSPDQQIQQLQQLAATPEGVVAFTLVRLVGALIFFLLIGMGSGALAVTLGRPRSGPHP
jgi:hypothetical protein